MLRFLIIISFLAFDLVASEQDVFAPFSKEMSDVFDSRNYNIYNLGTSSSILQAEKQSKDLSDYYEKRIALLDEYSKKTQAQLEDLSASLDSAKKNLQEYQTQIKILESVSKDEALFVDRYQADILKTKDKKKIKSLQDAIANAEINKQLRQVRIEEYKAQVELFQPKIKDLSGKIDLIQRKLKYANELESNYRKDLEENTEILDAISDFYNEAQERERIQEEYRQVEALIEKKEEALSASKDQEPKIDENKDKNNAQAEVQPEAENGIVQPEEPEQESQTKEQKNLLKEGSDLSDQVSDSKTEKEFKPVAQEKNEQGSSENLIVDSNSSVLPAASNNMADVTDLKSDSLSQLESVSASDFKELEQFTTHELALRRITESRIKSAQLIMDKLQQKYNSLDIKSKIVENLKYLSDRIKSLFTGRDTNSFENRSIKSRMRGLKESMDRLKINDFLENSKYERPGYLESFDIASIH